MTLHRYGSVLALFILLNICVGGISFPSMTAPVYLVADAQTSTIIRQHGQKRILAPASLAKLMSLYLIQQDIRNGLMTLDDVVKVPEEGAADAMRPASSVMGLSVGDEVTVLTLMRAAAIISAGDAVWTLALYSAGTVEKFVNRMNVMAKDLGMTSTHYIDPDGWSARSWTTGLDQLTMALAYIKTFPDSLKNIHSLPRMVLRQADKVLIPYAGGNNTNLLISKLEGADGLKTGTIPEAGFHLVGTAKRNGQRFVAMVMGIQAPVLYQGQLERSKETALLLEWAFENYETVDLQWTYNREQPVRHGSVDKVSLSLEFNAPKATVLKGQHIFCLTNINDNLLIAPVMDGQVVGLVQWYADGNLIKTSLVFADRSIDRQWNFNDFIGTLF